MADAASFSHVKQTFEDWSMFETVIRHNYMHHEDLVQLLADVVREIAGPLTIVDLGCGDAWLASHAFQQTRWINISPSIFRKLL